MTSISRFSGMTQIAAKVQPQSVRFGNATTPDIPDELLNLMPAPEHLQALSEMLVATAAFDTLPTQEDADTLVMLLNNILHQTEQKPAVLTAPEYHILAVSIQTLAVLSSKYLMEGTSSKTAPDAKRQESFELADKLFSASVKYADRLLTLHREKKIKLPEQTVVNLVGELRRSSPEVILSQLDANSLKLHHLIASTQAQRTDWRGKVGQLLTSDGGVQALVALVTGQTVAGDKPAELAKLIEDGTHLTLAEQGTASLARFFGVDDPTKKD